MNSLQQRKAVRALLELIVETAKDFRTGTFGGIPSGELYALLMPTISYEVYIQTISSLERAGFIRNRGHLITWVRDLPPFSETPNLDRVATLQVDKGGIL